MCLCVCVCVSVCVGVCVCVCASLCLCVCLSVCTYVSVLLCLAGYCSGGIIGLVLGGIFIIYTDITTTLDNTCIHMSFPFCSNCLKFHIIHKDFFVSDNSNIFLEK